MAYIQEVAQEAASKMSIYTRISGATKPTHCLCAFVFAAVATVFACSAVLLVLVQAAVQHIKGGI